MTPPRMRFTVRRLMVAVADVEEDRPALRSCEPVSDPQTGERFPPHARPDMPSPMCISQIESCSL
jgi:hypothetical protein